MSSHNQAQIFCPDLLREILAALMMSPLYFELSPAERLSLIKSLAQSPA